MCVFVKRKMCLFVSPVHHGGSIRESGSSVRVRWIRHCRTHSATLSKQQVACDENMAATRKNVRDPSNRFQNLIKLGDWNVFGDRNRERFVYVWLHKSKTFRFGHLNNDYFIYLRELLFPHNRHDDFSRTRYCQRPPRYRITDYIPWRHLAIVFFTF